MEEIKEEPLEKLEDYFYRYFSIPSYDGIPAEKRLDKKEWLQAYTNLAVSKERERIWEGVKKVSWRVSSSPKVEYNVHREEVKDIINLINTK